MSAQSVQPAERAPHWLALDGLRGIAVLLVVADHGGFTFRRPLGAAGVTIFFVLSGFLITNVITRSRNTGAWSFREFFSNRMIRLYPALLAMVLVVGLWWLLAGRPLGSLLEYAGSTLLYLEDFFHVAHNMTVFGHTWSLSVEEQFYVLWPFIVPLARTKRAALWIVGAGIGGSIILRLGLLRWGFADFSYGNVATNAYALLIGCGIALLRPSFGRRRGVAGVIAAVALIVFAFAPKVPEAAIVAPIFVAVAAGVLLVAVLPGSRLLELPPLRFAGRISYALYLWHWPLLLMAGVLDHGVGALPALALSIVVATASTLLVEEPLRRRWRSRHTRWRRKVEDQPPARNLGT